MFVEGGTDGGTDNSIWVLAGDREEGGPGKGCRDSAGQVTLWSPPCRHGSGSALGEEGGSGRLHCPGATE